MQPLAQLAYTAHVPCLFSLAEIFNDTTKQTDNGDCIGFVLDVSCKRVVSSVSATSFSYLQISLVDETCPQFPILYEITGPRGRHRSNKMDNAGDNGNTDNNFRDLLRTVKTGCMLCVLGFTWTRSKDGRVTIRGGSPFPIYISQLQDADTTINSALHSQLFKRLKSLESWVSASQYNKQIRFFDNDFVLRSLHQLLHVARQPSLSRCWYRLLKMHVKKSWLISL
jgi:hypothetical protein